MYRHGDVLVAAAEIDLTAATQRPNQILAHGERTGHTHRIAEAGAAELYELEGTLYLKVVAEVATLIHEEHKPIALPRGTYKVWQQREYTPEAIRTVYD